MASTTTKKVYLRRFDQALLAGYVNPRNYLRPEGIELLDRAAQVHLIPYRSVKAVYFVRDFDDAAMAETRAVFQSRPKTGGLWIRMEFRDGDMLEGVLHNDLLQVGAHGITATPPDSRSAAQLVFVPREALVEAKVLGVIGRPVRPARRRPASREQMPLLDRQAERP